MYSLHIKQRLPFLSLLQLFNPDSAPDAGKGKEGLYFHPYQDLGRFSSSSVQNHVRNIDKIGFQNRSHHMPPILKLKLKPTSVS
jgi:hypothetical protein